ncbi:MAG: glycosyl transferase [Ignavibacteria bacterium]|nr:glycosyl transferase [Ignavibacteria bacterium]
MIGKRNNIAFKSQRNIVKCSDFKYLIFDLLLSSILLLITAIPMIFIAVAIMILDGYPILYFQTRMGRAMNPFCIYKFRTMKMHTSNENSLTVGKDFRITKLGHCLRRFHLDELPQLFNIIMGEMSIIGPRPEIPEFIDVNNKIHQQILSVKPGLFDNATLNWIDEAKILGLVDNWQEYYRKIILPDKLNMSLNDIQNRSLLNNIKLIIKAVTYILLIYKTTKKLEVTNV